MKTLFGLVVGAALAATTTAAPVFASDSPVGTTPPEIEAVKWYNTVPLTFEELQGRAVLVEVFRTW